MQQAIQNSIQTMDGFKTCGKRKCRGWPSEVESIDKTSNEPLLVYCKCNNLGRKCIKCDNIAKFGFNSPLTCFYHKNHKMVNVNTRRCQEKGCIKIPLFNTPDENHKIFCYAHRKDGMINVGNYKCDQERCYRLPKYNDPGEKQGLYCLDHFKEGMIDVVSVN